MNENRVPRREPNPPPQQQQRRSEMRVRPTGPIVPSANVSGHALMCVIAIMSFLACLTLGGVSMVRATAQSWQSQISREITIQIKPDDNLDMERALADARDLALTFSGTTGGTIIDRAATARLLEPWLGGGLDLNELPVPRLVVVTIDESNPPDFAAMRKALTETIPQAFLDDHRTWVDRLVAMASTTTMIGTGVLVLVFSAMVLTVVFATRGARPAIAHRRGPSFRRSGSEFRRRRIPEALSPNQSEGRRRRRPSRCAVLCAGEFWQSQTLATPETDQATALFGTFAIGYTGYLGIFGIIVVIALLTTLTARLTVMRTIYEIDLIRSDPGRTDTFQG